MLLVGKAFKQRHEDGVVNTCEVFELGDYFVDVDKTRLKNGHVITLISICHSIDKEYLPSIYYRTYRNKEKNHFEIQTTAYGALDADEIRKVIAGYQQALEAVEILERNFC